MLQGKHILVGISGGIAAYKIPELIRLLIKQGAEVKVTTTQGALHFVTELTLETVSNHKVYTDVFAPRNEHSTEHISLPDWADIFVVAPATANVIGKMANGIADDALTTTFLAMQKPVLVAPAMNDKMYAHPAVRKNMSILRSWPHIRLLDCEEGFLACGAVGNGRMQDVNVILAEIDNLLTPKTLQKKNVLLTAGPTRERLDPVRYISNFSTGKMGYALAVSAAKRGAEVTLISGPVNPDLKRQIASFSSIHLVEVESAHEMHELALEHFPTADIAILCAAVADYTPCEVANQKMKRCGDSLNVSLQPTADIAADLGQSKRPNQVLIGFALETQDEEVHAIEKMRRKNLDMIVLNSLNDEGAGFGYDTNKVTLIYANQEKQTLPLMNKINVAEAIIDAIK